MTARSQPSKANLTKRTVDLATVPEGKDRLLIWDTKLRGFGLFVSAKGVKSFVLNYRVNGRERRHTIGRYGEMTPEAARNEAMKLLTAVRGGADPQEDRVTLRNVKTLAGFWPEYRSHASTRWKPATALNNDSRWRLHIEPRLGSKRLDEITRRAIVDFHNGMKDDPGTVSANRCLGLLRAILNVATEWELLSRNPATGVKPFPERSCERFLTAEETSLIFRAIEIEERLGGVAAVHRIGESVRGRRGGKGMKECESRGITPHAGGLFRLLILTGARLSEIRDCRWHWWNRDRACLELPDSKTGAKRIWLNAPAMDELLRLWKLRTQDVYIIEGRLAGQPLNNGNKPWRRVCARADKLFNEQRIEAGEKPLASGPFENLRIHDLRHSFASFGVLNGLPLQIIGKTLGHSNARTTERYAHLADDPAQHAAAAIGDAIERARAGGARVLQITGKTSEKVAGDE